jgi:hypothetical protein
LAQCIKYARSGVQTPATIKKYDNISLTKPRNY